VEEAAETDDDAGLNDEEDDRVLWALVSMMLCIERRCGTDLRVVMSGILSIEDTALWSDTSSCRGCHGPGGRSCNELSHSCRHLCEARPRSSRIRGRERIALSQSEALRESNKCLYEEIMLRLQAKRGNAIR
jgi:hypothetical protein